MHHMGEASMKFADRTTVSFKAAMYLGVAALAVGMTSTAQAQAAEAKQIDIPAQSLANTLTQIGRQTSSEVVFQPADVREIGRASCRESVCQCRSRWSPYH